MDWLMVAFVSVIFLLGICLSVLIEGWKMYSEEQKETARRRKNKYRFDSLCCNAGIDPKESLRR